MVIRQTTHESTIVNDDIGFFRDTLPLLLSETEFVGLEVTNDRFYQSLRRP